MGAATYLNLCIETQITAGDGLLGGCSPDAQQGRRMMEDMAQVHMTEAELARDLHGVLEKVRQGTEVVIEQDHRPVAVIKTPQESGRMLSECIALAQAHGSTATLDPDFGKDLEDIIQSRREPLASRWD